MIELLVILDREVSLAGIKIDDTLQGTLQMMTGGLCFGLLAAIVIGFLFHFTITRNVIHLTQTAARFHAGNLEARAQIESQDELGDLARTFNKMADEVDTLTAELREQANRDPLTGLFNRRYMDETLPRELAQATRTGSPVSMVMIDLDNLKEINDQHGHAVGDRILIELANIFAGQSRLGDVACRFGGDEFLVLLPGAKSGDAATRTEHWKQALEEIQVSSRGKNITTTISAGIVQWKPGETSQELFARVDGALYIAKNIGRNNIYIDSKSP
jgi:diguanylate cyclase (GGDEF)-like protein